MIYPLSFQVAGLSAGAALLVAHAVALWRPGKCMSWLKAFPRSRPLGTALLLIAAVWSFLLVGWMDLGEFARLRHIMQGAIVAGAYLAWRYVEEFLAVRSLGMLALLAAEPLLGAAFLRPETTRLLMVLLAYGWVILGLFWVSIPWLLRDQIRWLTANPARFRIAALAGAIYGAALLLCAAILWR